MMLRVLIAVAMISGLSSTLTEAHEVRDIGGYTLAVGFRGEPAFEDVVNAIDIFINRTSDDKVISVREGDIVDLQVVVQLRAADDFDAPILHAALLAQKPRQDFATPNRYNAWFKPTHDGAYAFHITGVLADASDPQAGTVAVDATFVCGGGTQSDTTAFNCVEDPQTFPGGVSDTLTGKDQTGYRDNDEFSLR